MHIRISLEVVGVVAMTASAVATNVVTEVLPASWPPLPLAARTAPTRQREPARSRPAREALPTRRAHNRKSGTGNPGVCPTNRHAATG